MAYLIGTDEAGYGPNLGPLIVSTSVWRVADGDLNRDLYQRLQPCVSADPADEKASITIADSKVLYRPKGNLSGLERGVLPALILTQEQPHCWRQLWSLLSPAAPATMDQLAWYQNYESHVPFDLSKEELADSTEHLKKQLEQADVELISIGSKAVFPGEFNRIVEQSGSKGALLSETTLELIGDQLDRLPAEPTLIICDKHGGRNHYAGLLQPSLAKGLVRVIREGRAESAYDIGSPDHSIRICFRAKGESFLPSALASMASKYLREVAMGAFNQFWQTQLEEELKPTAGYPVDAKRFKQQIEKTQAKLGIPDREIWRMR